METTPSPYDSAIEEIEGKIRHFQSVLDTLKALRAGGADGSVPASPGSREADSEIRHDTFFGMTIADAARKYLAIVKHTKPTAEIAAALESGGMKHASKDFAMTLRSVLSPREEFIRVNNDWGLTEWYPGMGRGRKAKPDKAREKSKREPRATKPATQRSGGSRRTRVLTLMMTNPNKDWTAKEVADELKDSRTSVQSVMSVESKPDGTLTKSALGYRVKK